MGGLGEVPKMLSLKRRQGQLEGLSKVSSMEHLDQQQMQELQERTRAKELELEALKKHFAAEMTKRPVRYIGIPVATTLTPAVPRVGSPTHAQAVSARGMTRWGAQLQMVRQRLPTSPERMPSSPGGTYAQKVAVVRSLPPKAVGA